MIFPIFQIEAKSILSPTSGFIAAAGFTHSLTPARNCTFGCSYCYVPTMRIQGGLRPEDWRRWGQFTTFKVNTTVLLERSLRPDQVIYCSPLVDPYQPAEEQQGHMPLVIDRLIDSPPRVFVIQTRGPLILRDLSLLQKLSKRTTLRISFSITTNREPIRRLFEPHCATFAERLRVIRELRCAGIRTHATLAPLLPCDVEELVGEAITASGEDLVGDPLHIRAVKRRGATTRDAAWKIAAHHGYQEWFDAAFQARLVEQIRDIAEAAGKRFATGPEGFSWLTRTS